MAEDLLGAPSPDLQPAAGIRSTLRQVSQVVGGKYVLLRLLGAGSMGEVWLARHRTLGEEVAVKLLKPSGWYGDPEDAAATARFRFEAQLAAHLSRKTRHIVRVTDHGEEDGVAFLVMELLEGQTLHSKLLRYATLPPQDVSTIVTQIARGLAEAHREGVVHRDLKPANVFLARDDGGELRVTLLDFGIARATSVLQAGRAFVTEPGLIFGTPGYMSPEQARSPSATDHRGDLWALATVAYEALTGEIPIPGDRPVQLMQNLHARRIVPVHARAPSLPSALAEFFEKAFAASIDDRFSSATELAAAFERAVSSPRQTRSRWRGGTLVMRTLVMKVRPNRMRRPDGRRPPSVAAAMVCGALLGAALLAAVGFARSAHRPSGPSPTIAVEIAAKGNAEVAPLLVGAPAGSTSLRLVPAEGGVAFPRKAEIPQ
jgi:serine/threonine-protein kinase